MKFFSLFSHIWQVLKPSVHTGICHLLEFALYHSTFTEDVNQYLFLLTKRNMKRIYTYTKKDKKREQHLACVLQQCSFETVCSPSSKSGPTKILPLKLCSAFQHQAAAIALNYVCEHLCFASSYFVHLFARCVLQ